MGVHPLPDMLGRKLIDELATVDQLVQVHLRRALPAGMEMSHFLVVDFLETTDRNATPAELARIFRVTKGAMTNTLNRLSRAGFIFVGPDYEDGRRKLVRISDAGRAACERAREALHPIYSRIHDDVGGEEVETTLNLLRRVRTVLDKTSAPKATSGSGLQ